MWLWGETEIELNIVLGDFPILLDGHIRSQTYL
jgi:hypothetical protein